MTKRTPPGYVAVRRTAAAGSRAGARARNVAADLDVDADRDSNSPPRHEAPAAPGSSPAVATRCADRATKHPPRQVYLARSSVPGALGANWRGRGPGCSRSAAGDGLGSVEICATALWCARGRSRSANRPLGWPSKGPNRRTRPGERAETQHSTTGRWLAAPTTRIWTGARPPRCAKSGFPPLLCHDRDSACRPRQVHLGRVVAGAVRGALGDAGVARGQRSNVQIA